MAYIFGKTITTLSLLVFSCISLFSESLDNLDSLQESTRKWIQLRLENTAMQSDWEWQQDILTATLAALKIRVQNLEQEKELLEIQNQSCQKTLADLESELTLLRNLSKESEKIITVIFQQILELRPALPPRLQDALQLSFNSLEDSDTPFPSRLQALVTILNRSVMFNNTITFSEEVIVKADGSERLLQVLYWGLSHAYGLDQGSGTAYMGIPLEGQWVWIPKQEITPQVHRLFAIFHEEQDPALVEVPAGLH